jgi:hypothetical protein
MRPGVSKGRVREKCWVAEFARIQTVPASKSRIAAAKSLSLEKDYAHGWRGNITDTLPMQN